MQGRLVAETNQTVLLYYTCLSFPPSARRPDNLRFSAAYTTTYASLPRHRPGDHSSLSLLLSAGSAHPSSPDEEPLSSSSPRRALPLSRNQHGDIILPDEDVGPRGAVLALPAAARLSARASDDAQGAGVAVAGVRGGLEAEAALDLQAGVAAEVADVPQRVRLALEQRDDDGAAGGPATAGRGRRSRRAAPGCSAPGGLTSCSCRRRGGEVEDDAVHGAPRGSRDFLSASQGPMRRASTPYSTRPAAASTLSTLSPAWGYFPRSSDRLFSSTVAVTLAQPWCSTRDAAKLRSPSPTRRMASSGEKGIVGASWPVALPCDGRSVFFVFCCWCCWCLAAGVGGGPGTARRFCASFRLLAMSELQKRRSASGGARPRLVWPVPDS